MTYSSAGSHYRQILLLIIESGLVITCFKTLEFILFELSPNGLVGLNALYVLFLPLLPHLNPFYRRYVILDSMPQIMVRYPRFHSGDYLNKYPLGYLSNLDYIGGQPRLYETRDIDGWKLKGHLCIERISSRFYESRPDGQSGNNSEGG
jgi:hypothetical protein